MNNSKKQPAADSLSPFGTLALKLDEDFSALVRISGQIERLDIETDAGLERAIKLMSQFTVHGQSISTDILEFSKALQDARDGAEKAAQSVAARAQLVQERKEAQDQIQEQIGVLGQGIKKLTSGLSKTAAPEQLQELCAELENFTAEAKAVKDRAQGAGFQSLARNAESLYGTLLSAQRKLGTVLPPAPGSPASDICH